jgi:hypothetical protein
VPSDPTTQLHTLSRTLVKPSSCSSANASTKGLRASWPVTRLPSDERHTRLRRAAAAAVGRVWAGGVISLNLIV